MRCRPSTRDAEVHLDPWGRNAADDVPPDDLALGCRYRAVHQMILDLDVSAFFRRAGGLDELWIAAVDRFDKAPARAATASARGTVEESCRDLLMRVIRARSGYEAPTAFLAAGMLDESDYLEILADIQREHDAAAAAAEQNETEIVRAARSLGLYVRSSGQGADHWYASCPGTNHSLGIAASTGQFFCGYCKRSGGEEALREFVRERNGRGGRW